MLNMGTEFIWWMGVVEDRGDPLQLGRCRVRCYGFHSQSKSDTPTDNLPWAQPIQSITSAAMGDVGHTALGLVEGTWVVGFFLDGKEAQRPVIMGSIAALPTEAGNPSLGFNDPTGRTKENNLSVWESHSEDQPYVSRYPRGTTLPAENYSEANEEFKTGEKENDRLRPDTNRLARNAGHPVLGAKDSTKTEKVKIAFWDKEQPYGVESEDDEELKNGNDIIGNKQGNKRHTVDASSTVDSINTDVDVSYWNEPATSDKTKNGSTRYSTSYPHNHVFESESGHIKEYDDTKDSTRIHEYHRSDTFYEIEHDGNKHTRIVGNDYEIIAGTNFVNIKGDVNLTIDANCKTYIKGDWDIQVDGNKSELIRGNHSETIQGDQSSTVIQNVTEAYGTDTSKHSHRTTVTGSHSESISSTQTSSVTGAVTETYSSNLRTDISGTTGIKHGGVATYHYVDDFKEKIDRDHYVDKEGGKVDHNHPIIPARTSALTEVEGL